MTATLPQPPRTSRQVVSRIVLGWMLVAVTFSGCRRSNPRMTANEIFESELRRRGASFSRVDEGLYSVRVADTDYTVSTENVGRNFERDRDPGAVIRFVERVLSPIRWPDWEWAKSLVFYSAERSDLDFGDALQDEVTATVRRVLVLTDVREGTVTWLTPRALSDWKVSQADLRVAAARNLDALLAGKRLEVTFIDGMKLGMVPVESVFKASVIFAPGFKRFVSTELGWPVLAVVPCRDFVYVLAEKDSALLQRMGEVVGREYRGSGYPITTEVLRISDDGIRAVGHFGGPT